MTWWEAVAIFVAGIGAGTINAMVGSGTLITFPTLLAFGYSPVAANISNNIGLVPGGASGTWGYRHELRGQVPALRRLLPMSCLGAVTGAMLLLRLPERVFSQVVPALLAISLVLVVVQPRLQARLKRRRLERGVDPGSSASLGAVVGTYFAGVYGGYFGAAQGVLLIGLLGSLLPQPLQRINAVKNLLTLVVNGVAAALFCLIAFEEVVWSVVALISLGSLLGGAVGACVGRRLPASALRAVIVMVGLVAMWRLSA